MVAVRAVMAIRQVNREGAGSSSASGRACHPASHGFHMCRKEVQHELIKPWNYEVFL